MVTEDLMCVLVSAEPAAVVGCGSDVVAERDAE
jgi:hypothetical protein